MIALINPIKILILLTFVHFVIRVDRRKKIDALLFLVLAVNLFNEVLSGLLRHYQIKLATSSNVYILLHATIWLLLLAHVAHPLLKKRFSFFAYGYFIMALVFLLTDVTVFQIVPLIVGALLYVALFIYDCSLRMQREELGYFSSDRYLLVTAPLLFFIGLGILFGFKNKQLHQTHFAGIQLFHIISYFTNAIYYILINVYIYKHSRRKPT